MLAAGNSEVEACSHCLLSAMQREIPFARSKGLDPDVYDVAFDDAETLLDEAARNVLGAYESRVDVESVVLDFGEDENGDETTYTVTLVDPDEDINDGYDEGDDY